VDAIGDWWVKLGELLSGLVESFLGYLPQILGALAVLLLGWMIAAVLRALTQRGLRTLGHLIPRALSGGTSAWRHLLHPGLISGIVFWGVIFAFTVVAAQVLGLAIFVAWLDTLFRHLPLIFLALLILISGGLISQLLRESVVAAAAAAGLEYRLLLGYAVQATIFTMAVVIALDLVGLDISFLVTLAAILVAAVSGGAALAFGLGARTVVSNLLGMRAIHQRIKESDFIRVGELEGHVVELGRRFVVVENDDGRVTIPGHYFSEHACTVVMPEGDRG